MPADHTAQIKDNNLKITIVLIMESVTDLML